MVSFFWVSGIINSMLSIYPRKNDEEKKELLYNTFLSLIIFSFIAGGCLFLFANNLLSFLSKDNDKNLIKLSVIYLLLSNPSFIIEYIFFLNDKRGEIIGYGSVTFIITVIVALVPIALGYPVQYSMYGLIVVAAMKLVLSLVLLIKYATLKVNLNLQVTSLKLSAPLIASIFVSGSAEYVDGVIVKSKFDNVFFAIYRYGAKELPVLLIIANTFSTAMIPAIAANLEDGLMELKAKSARMMHFFFPVSIALMMVSPYIYRYGFNESFTYSAVIFNIYLLLIIPRVLFPQTILTGMQQTNFLLISSILEIIINVSLSIYLAGKIGLAGIAVGTFVAYLFDKVFLVLVNYFFFGINPIKYVQLIPYFVYTVLTFVSFFFSYWLMKIS